jgi:hypothetical protein
MDSNIKFWWEYSFKQGQLVQAIENSPEDNKIDGKSIWSGIECQVSSVNITDLKYNESLRSIYEEMDRICDKHNISANELNPKSNHFFMQLQNLIVKKSNFEIKLNRVLQLAYNAGQLSQLIEINKISEDIKEFVHRNNLLSLDTYVSLDNQKIINERYLNGTHLDKIRETIHMIGGGVTEDNYYFKYLKYKYKYLLEKKLKKMI